MSDMVRHRDPNGQGATVLRAYLEESTDQSQQSRHQKWPLWYTVIGVCIVCSVFWIGLFALIF